MFLLIKDILKGRELRKLLDLSTKVSFVDGRATNPDSPVKNNLQSEFGTDHSKEISAIVTKAAFRSRAFVDFTFPKIMAAPLMGKYEPGMHYGFHADTAILAYNPPIRSDISMTLFLSDPATYEGGELQMSMGDGDLRFKGEPGEMILYPSTMAHQVRPVTSGLRLVCITFIQSLVKDQSKREILYNLNELYALEADNMDPENRTRLDVVRNNLGRMWSDF